MKKPYELDRRRLLKGMGVTLGLPMLDALMPRRGQAAEPRKIYSAFVLQANGVVQAWDKEPELFWPRAVNGALSKATMETTDADRATSELAAWAHKLLMVKGLRFGFAGNGCGHSGGGNQVLTAARVSDAPRGNRSLAMGESLDNRIARELTPGREPLALYAGRKSGYIDDNLSFRGPKQLRAAENNPWNAYSRLVGLGNAAGDPELAKKLVARRKSINDLLRTQIRDVTGRADLSAEDRRRIDLHLSSVRDIELSLIKQLPPDAIAPLKAMDGKHRDPVNMEVVMRLQMDLLAFALASDYARTATLQIGDGNDSTQYVIGGEKLPSFHQISHRIFSDGAEGAPIPLAVEMHHKIDRLHARAFKYFVDKVAAYSMPGGGTLLDDSFLVWTNSLANGPPHSYEGVPYVIAGSAGGYLKQGMVVSVANDPATKKKTTNNKLFNTLLAAAGVRKEGGAPVDDFGDPSLPKGGIVELVAG